MTSLKRSKMPWGCDERPTYKRPEGKKLPRRGFKKNLKHVKVIFFI